MLMFARRLATLTLWIALIAPTAQAITIDTVPIGNPGNANDPATGYGGVADTYRIGATEVTVGQYTAFLNAVAATDTYSLYNASMGTDGNIKGIARNGISGSYSYSVIGSPNHPVTYVSWGDAARFANWLHNGQTTGAEGPGTTETGAYTLNGAVTDAALFAVQRNTGAKWFIPTEDEWYKAAYQQPAAQGGDTDNYWNYPMKTNNLPYSDQPPGATPDNTRVGNFYQDDGLTNGYNDGYATTGSTTYTNLVNYLTDVGAYASSPGYYGTFDQGGNVFEWNSAQIIGTDGLSRRGLRGGAWGYGAIILAATFRGSQVPTYEANFLGFRLATVPTLSPTGDYNGNGVVDAADYTVWRDTLGSTTDLRANGDNTGASAGKIDQADYNVWKANFGMHAGSGAASAIPEPSAIFLIASGICALAVNAARLGRAQAIAHQLLLTAAAAKSFRAVNTLPVIPSQRGR
jgi:formylglycine-generating enzyme